MQLDTAAAVRALDGIAERLGLTGENRAVAAAEAALRVASAKMGTEITKLLATAGVDPREFALVAYGGAGPTHANLLAAEAGLTSVIVPTAPGTFCALGAILADVRRDYIRTIRRPIGPAAGREDGWADIVAVIDGLEKEARAWVASEGEIVGEHEMLVSFSLRYQGQAYELAVGIPPGERDGLSARQVCDLFHAEHDRLYGFCDLAVPVETATARLGVVGKVPPVELPQAAPGQPKPQRFRPLWHGGHRISAAVFQRTELGAGALIHGPAIVEQLDTTTFILPGWLARADRLGALHLTREVGA
jgi:N-methylhydantoinase A